MRTIKKIASMLCAVAVLASSMSFSVSAYEDGDREVDYYDFEIIAGYNYEGDPSRPITSGIEKRFPDRNWVVSVNSVSSTKYAVHYRVLRYTDPCNPDNNLGYTEFIATECSIKGTGNSGGRYIEDVCEGTEIYMLAGVSSLAPQGTLMYTSGQWSPDAPY